MYTTFDCCLCGIRELTNSSDVITVVTFVLGNANSEALAGQNEMRKYILLYMYESLIHIIVQTQFCKFIQMFADTKESK